MAKTSDLYTGATSGTFRNIKLEQRKEIEAEKNVKKGKLLPAYHIVEEYLDAELVKVEKQILGFININTPPENVKEILVSLNLYEASIKGLKTHLKNIVRKEV